MVLLTMTPSIVEALVASELPPSNNSDDETASSHKNTEESSLENPEVGNPISHGQIISLWKHFGTRGKSSYSLDQLLRGATVYIPPPPPKPEPSPEYKALMARLRRDEEARSYERMMNAAPRHESFQDRFPKTADLFAEANRPTKAEDLGDDDVTYEEVHRQVMLIINFLVSIVGVAGTLWVTARWWSTPSRLFLTLGGSILVGIAEVAVYNGYIWRMGNAKKKQGAVKEVKEVVETWVVGKDNEEAGEAADDTTVIIKEKANEVHDNMRKRIVESTTKT